MGQWFHLAKVLVQQLPDGQSLAVITTIALENKVKWSWRAKVKELVANSKRKVQMNDVREQVARISSLFTRRSVLFQKAKYYKHE